MRLTYKYRLYPTKHQTAFLDDQLREACELYNAAKQERDGAWKTCRKFIGLYDQQNQLPAMRADGCLKIVNAQCAQNVLHRVDDAYKAFFRRVKRGEKPGFPRYRSVQRYDSLTFPTNGNGCRLLNNSKLRMQGAGHIKIKLHRPVEGKIKTITIKRKAGKWFACFSVEQDAKPLPLSNRMIGIDVGLSAFATLSDGTAIVNPRYYRKAQAKLRICQRKVARRKKGSKRRRKAVVLLQRAYAHVSNQRADFHHKEARKLVNRYELIAVEDLNVEGLAGGMLSKSINDAGWGQFLGFIAYKAEYAGRRNPKVDPNGTSQYCICGARVPKTLGNRWHHCTICGLSVPRDHMSAMLIEFRGRSGPSGANVEVVNSCVA